MLKIAITPRAQASNAYVDAFASASSRLNRAVRRGADHVQERVASIVHGLDGTRESFRQFVRILDFFAIATRSSQIRSRPGARQMHERRLVAFAVALKGYMVSVLRRTAFHIELLK